MPVPLIPIVSVAVGDAFVVNGKDLYVLISIVPTPPPPQYIVVKVKTKETIVFPIVSPPPGFAMVQNVAPGKGMQILVFVPK